MQKFPILGDIPVLGAVVPVPHAFQRDQSSELVIIITPYLVKLVDPPYAG